MTLRSTGRLETIAACLVFALAALSSPSVGATEVFNLSQGGQLIGKWLNQEENLRTHYDLETTTGIKIKLDRTQVAKVVHQRPAEEEYAQIKTKFADTAEAQWELADWCRVQNLAHHREVHLKRIIELDPDHARARAALGYTRGPDGWMTQAQRMQKGGYVLYRGRWRLTQEVELMEQKDKNERAIKEWYRKLKMYRGWLADRSDRKFDEANKRLKAIDDPYAVKALADALKEEPDPDMRKKLVETLAQIDSLDAKKALVFRTLDDPVDEVRYTAMDFFKERDPDLVAMYLGALRSKDNVIINRAAEGLKRLKHPAAVGALIDTLVTTHKFKVTVGNPGSMSMSFAQPASGSAQSAVASPGGTGFGGMGFSAGGGTQVVTQIVSNQKVLDTLVSLTGENFQFNVNQWKFWLSTQKSPASAATRRD